MTGIERIKNGGFEAYGPTTGIPDNWSCGNDRTTTTKHSGNRGMYVGEVGNGCVNQTINVAVKLSEITVLGFWYKSTHVDNNDNCVLTFSDESTVSVTLTVQNGTWTNVDLMSSIVGKEQTLLLTKIQFNNVSDEK